MTPTLAWRAFDELRLDELHAILKLRGAVFVVEQACPYADIDGLDPSAEHLLATAGGALVGTLRTFAPDDGVARIGRVAVAARARGTGLGRAMMAAALERLAARHPGAAVEVSAQSHLEAFYASLGFARRGPDHLIDAIAHVDMRRPGGAT